VASLSRQAKDIFIQGAWGLIRVLEARDCCRRTVEPAAPCPPGPLHELRAANYEPIQPASLLAAPPVEQQHAASKLAG
jgi:hypothetical protein